MASQLESAPELALGSEMPMASQALGSGSVIPESLAWVPESVPVWEQDSESVPVWEQDSDSVPAWVPGLASVSVPESALGSGSVPAWVPESVWARESGLPTVPAWVPGLASVSVPESALGSGSVPGLEPESDLASGRALDRTRRYRQTFSSRFLRLLPKFFLG